VLSELSELESRRRIGPARPRSPSSSNKVNIVTYAIIGSGAIGSALARQFARKGITVAVANRSGPASIAGLAEELGPSIVPSPLAEAFEATVVILAVPFSEAPRVGRERPDWSGKIVIDATNAINFADFTPADLGGRLSTHVIAEAFPGARMVKAFNTLPAAVLALAPETSGGRRVLFVSSDDGDAGAAIAALATDLGFAPVALGRIAEGGRLQQFGGPLMVHNLIKQG